MNFFDAKFHNVNIRVANEQEKRDLVQYVLQVSCPERLLPLLKTPNPSLEDVYKTDAVPDLEIGTLEQGWVYNSLYNTIVDKKKLFFHKKLYQTTLHKGSDTRIIHSKKPITIETIPTLL